MEWLTNAPFLKKERGFLLLIMFIFIAFVVLFSFASFEDVLKNQVTVYPEMITKENKLIPLNRSVYKVFPETQTVVSWCPGIAEVPNKLARCSVRDRLHWRCEYSDGSATLSMDDGRFQILSKDNLPERDVLYVSRLQWWILHLRI